MFIMWQNEFLLVVNALKDTLGISQPMGALAGPPGVPDIAKL